MSMRLTKQKDGRRGGPWSAAGKNQQRASSRPGKRFLEAGRLLFILGILAYGLFGTGLSGGTIAAGKTAPDVTLNTANGEFRLSEQRGKVLLLYFSFPG